MGPEQALGTRILIAQTSSAPDKALPLEALAGFEAKVGVLPRENLVVQLALAAELHRLHASISDGVHAGRVGLEVVNLVEAQAVVDGDFGADEHVPPGAVAGAGHGLD